MSAHSQTLPASPDGSARAQLPDGRALGYRESGDPAGIPLVYFHGIPGSRFQGPDDGVAREHCVRLIVPERPGYGLSDAAPDDYSLAAWAADVAALADALALERFAVAGYSAGGVFGLACAQALAPRVTRLGLIGSFAPFDDPADWEGWGPTREFYALAKADAAALRQTAEPLAATAETFLAAIAGTLCERDQTVLAAPPVYNAFLRDARETVRRGADAVVRDVLLVAHPWGIELGGIRVPTIIWHGLDDITVPPAMGRHLASMLPDCRAHFLPNEGHLPMLERWPEILTALVG